jgi:flagellar motility protein MotE (MotC chaperone)
VSTSDEDEENYYQTGMVYVPNEKDLEYKEDRGPLDLTRRVEELEKELAIQKERAQAAELETSLVKGTGMNSPEMLNAKKEIKELKELLKSRDYTKAHDYKFLVDENKKLHKEVDDLKRNKEKRMIKTREAGF